MSTFLQMQSKIATRIKRSDLTTEIKEAINEAIDIYDSKSFYFQETSGSFNTVASQESYGTSDSLPSDIREIDKVTITLSSTNKPLLCPRTFEYIRERNIGAATGTPDDYAWYSSKLWFAAIPNSAWAITVYYKKSYTALSADADTNDWTTIAENLILQCAIKIISNDVTKDFELADRMEKRERESFIILKKKSDQLVASGKVTPSTF